MDKELFNQVLAIYVTTWAAMFGLILFVYAHAKKKATQKFNSLLFKTRILVDGLLKITELTTREIPSVLTARSTLCEATDLSWDEIQDGEKRNRDALSQVMSKGAV